MPLRTLKLFFTLLVIFKGYFSYSQWQTISSGVTSNLVDGCFISDSTGFIVGSDGTVLKTIDAGSTWNTVATLTGYFTSVFPAGADTIYAGGNCIYRSDDGGNTWSLVTNLNDTITDLGFFGAHTGFAIVPNYSYCTWIDGTTAFDEFQVYKSIDFGSTWQPEFGYAESTSRFQFINDSTAFVTGGQIGIVAHCAGPWFSSCKRTTDRGNTWSFAAQPYFGHSYYSFINDTTGYYVQPGNTFSIYKTVDGGSTISQSYSEIYDSSIKQCKFLNEIDGYLLAGNNIYVTSSNGLYWSSEFNSTDSLNYLIDNTSNILFGIGSNGLIVRKETFPSAYSDTVYRVSLDNKSIHFGYVIVDSLATKTLSVRNTGNVPLDLSLSSSGNFKISFTNGPFVSNLNVALDSLQDTIVYVQFNPLLDQYYNDTLFITADSLDTIGVPLDGYGFYGLTGNIMQDTLICVDTLRIGSDITVKSSSKLTICAGTYVKLMGNFKITVEGLLEAIGDSANTIDFGVNDTSALWNGILLDNRTSADTSYFKFCNFIVNCNQPFIFIQSGIANIDYCNFSNTKFTPGAAIRAYRFTSPCIIKISNSNIYNVNSSAIACDICDTAVIYRNNIYNNNKGIVFSSSAGVYISENNIHDNGSEGIYGFGKLIVQGNKIYNNGGGIYFNDGRDVRIENNEIYNNQSVFTGGIKGSVSGGSTNINQNLIFNNTSEYGNGGGLNLAPDINYNTPTYITNNTICNNRVINGGLGHNFYATTNSSSGLGIKLFNNIFYDVSNSDNNIAWFPLVTHEISYNCINQDSINIWGQNNIDRNPRFVMPTDSIGAMTSLGNYDWSLTENSRCINAGDSINTFYLLPADFIGNQRIYNSRVDMGAFEFQGEYVEEPDTGNSNGTTLFPNPVNDLLTISAGTSNLTQVSLFDAAAKLVLKKEFISITTVDVRGLAKGIYLFEIRDESGLIEKGKFVKY